MPSLPQVLHEAANQSASEVVIEVGKDPVLLTDGGAVPFASPLSESDLFDALGQVLAPEQQAELAVGNIVEFNMDVDGARWTLLTEPSTDGLVVRGRAHGVAARVEVGTPMDLPPLEPFQPEAPPPEAATARRTVRETQWDLGVPDLSEDDAPAKSRFPSRSSQPAWVAEEADPLSASAQSHDVHAERTSRGTSEDRTVAAGGVGFPEPDDDTEEDGFEIRAPSASVVAPESPAPGGDSAGDDVSLMSFPTPVPGMGGPAPDIDAGAALRAPPLPDAPSISRNTRDVPLATVPAESEEEGEDDDELAQFGASVGPGSVCLVQGAGAGVRFAWHLNGGAFTVIDEHDSGAMTGTAVQCGPGSTYVVRLEDPSLCLGWMLRRLEEGARIVVETRARTLEGARRTLLGVSASPRAETWLAVHSLHWLVNQGGAWVMTSGTRR